VAAPQVVHSGIALRPEEVEALASARRASRFLAALPQPLFYLAVRLTLAKSRRPAQRDGSLGWPTASAVVRTAFSVDAGFGPCPVTCYYRKNLPPGPHPLFYFVHGGGFIAGSSRVNENLLVRLAEEVDVVCAAIDYHLAPEVRFPGAVEECTAGVIALARGGGRPGGLDAGGDPAGLDAGGAAPGGLDAGGRGVGGAGGGGTAHGVNAPGIDPDGIVLCGDSAGGNLAAATALVLGRRHGLRPQAQALLYPVTDLRSLATPSYLAPDPENRAMRKFIRACRHLYARAPADYADPLFSPAATTPNYDPEPTATLLLLAGHDGLLGDGLLYADHQADLGAEVRTVVYDNAHHAFINQLGHSGIAEHVFGEILQLIKG
jgi:acetyl esterase